MIVMVENVYIFPLISLKLVKKFVSLSHQYRVDLDDNG